MTTSGCTLLISLLRQTKHTRIRGTILQRATVQRMFGAIAVAHPKYLPGHLAVYCLNWFDWLFEEWLWTLHKRLVTQVAL